VAFHRLSLALVDGTYAICRLPGDAPIPPWAAAGSFVAIARTGDELSVVCRQNAVPEGVLCEQDWQCFRVEGTIPFSTVGVLASLTAPLADAGVGVFVVSTYDTDYLLVKARDFDSAVAALLRGGHTFS
jgi:hypothetical protein